jgi:hypothetical protein
MSGNSFFQKSLSMQQHYGIFSRCIFKTRVKERSQRASKETGEKVDGKMHRKPWKAYFNMSHRGPLLADTTAKWDFHFCDHT